MSKKATKGRRATAKRKDAQAAVRAAQRLEMKKFRPLGASGAIYDRATLMKIAARMDTPRHLRHADIDEIFDTLFGAR